MTMKKNTLSSPAAFSLIELIIYVTITSMMVVTMLLFVIRILDVRKEAELDREVIENARFVLSLFVREMHDGVGVNAGDFGSHPGALTLDTDGSGTWVMDTDTKTLGTQTLRYVQVDSGSGPVQITSDLVNVTNFVFTDLTRDTEPENIQLDMTLESIDGLSTASFRTAVSLRQ